MQEASLGDRDSRILQTPLNSAHEVKDNRGWALADNALDRWSMKQMGL